MMWWGARPSHRAKQLNCSAPSGLEFIGPFPGPGGRKQHQSVLLGKRQTIRFEIFSYSGVFVPYIVPEQRNSPMHRRENAVPPCFGACFFPDNSKRFSLPFVIQFDVIITWYFPLFRSVNRSGLEGRRGVATAPKRGIPTPLFQLIPPATRSPSLPAPGR
jgi:hypothetical protein